MDSDLRPGTAPRRPRRVTGSVIVILVVAALVYVPFYGPLLSLSLPVLTFIQRENLWPNSPWAASLMCSVLAWICLWWPALGHFFLGWSLGLSSEVSTSWLIIPLCGPVGPWTTLAPAAAAAVLCVVGLTLSSRAQQPWLWVVAACGSPWVHHLILTALPQHEFVC